MFNQKLFVLAFVIALAFVAGNISAGDLPSAASDMNTEQPTDHSTARVPNAAETADAAAEEAEMGEPVDAEEALDADEKAGTTTQ